MAQRFPAHRVWGAEPKERRRQCRVEEPLPMTWGWVKEEKVEKPF